MVGDPFSFIVVVCISCVMVCFCGVVCYWLAYLSLGMSPCLFGLFCFLLFGFVVLLHFSFVCYACFAFVCFAHLCCVLSLIACSLLLCFCVGLFGPASFVIAFCFPLTFFTGAVVMRVLRCFACGRGCGRSCSPSRSPSCLCLCSCLCFC